MKETVAAFRRRTGLAYAPPASLRVRGRPLGPREACPTLFRYPGPEGLQAFLGGLPGPLAPPGLDWVWLGAGPLVGQARRGRLFGTVAVLEPLRLSPCRTGRSQVWVGWNRPAGEPGSLAWVPPSAAGSPLAWDRIRDADDLRRRLGPRYEEERERVAELLGAYLEELRALRQAGAPGPTRPWCGVSAARRRTLLERYGVRARWT
ncbi:MAG TPA: hypothetical protein VLI67_03435 [Vicinamibacteria bacterium]|nr:hypothetical protein [Vicinamibacteria bacterium]